MVAGLQIVFLSLKRSRTKPFFCLLTALADSFCAVYYFQLHIIAPIIFVKDGPQFISVSFGCLPMACFPLLFACLTILLNFLWKEVRDDGTFYFSRLIPRPNPKQKALLKSQRQVFLAPCFEWLWVLHLHRRESLSTCKPYLQLR